MLIDWFNFQSSSILFEIINSFEVDNLYLIILSEDFMIFYCLWMKMNFNIIY